MTTPTLPRETDVCIIGGGPTGQTIAALLRRYRPATRVLVLERQHFPRHRIGEGFIVDINRIFADMGAYERLDAEGFPIKWGTTFVWGSDRRPCTFSFREAAALVDPPQGYQLGYTWHVDRPRFDELLAELSVEAGATFITGQRVLGPLRDGDRVTGVRVRDEVGREAEVRARWVIDCGGGGGPLSTTLGQRTFDQAIRNIAVFGYYAGIGYADDLNGPPDDRRTIILTHPQGWIWLIPVSREVTSVGFVTSIDAYRAAGVEDHITWLDGILGEIPEHGVLFGDAHLVDHREDGRLVHVIQEQSYTCQQVWGDGWALCGDAAGFVDPVLSIGVYVAMAHAQFLAYSLASVLDGDMSADLALGAYARCASDNCEAFRAVAHMFYAWNATRSDWWRECSGLLRQSVHVPADADRQAFLAFVTGFTARHNLYEEAVNAFGSDFLVSLGQQLFDGHPLTSDETLADEHHRARAVLAGDPALRMAGQWDLREFALPAVGTGRLRRVARLDVQLDAPGAAEHPDVRRIARRVHLEPHFADVPSLLDGRRRVSDVIAELQRRQPEVRDRAPVDRLLYRLALLGALSRGAA